MTQLTDISSPNWPQAATRAGTAPSLESLHQAIQIILRTPKGANPLRPDFGSDLRRYLDAPIDRARPHVAREVVEAIYRWEPRIRVDMVSLIGIDDGRAHLRVSWRLANGLLQQTEAVL